MIGHAKKSQDANRRNCTEFWIEPIHENDHDELVRVGVLRNGTCHDAVPHKVICGDYDTHKLVIAEDADVEWNRVGNLQVLAYPAETSTFGDVVMIEIKSKLTGIIRRISLHMEDELVDVKSFEFSQIDFSESVCKVIN